MKQTFKEPFIKIEQEEGVCIVYSATGCFSSIIKIDNPALQYGADKEYYENYHNLFGQFVKLLGDNYTIQKTDIICSKKFSRPALEGADYLSRKYFEHFEGRQYKELTTYITITREPEKKGKIFSFNARELKEFILKVKKLVDTLGNQKIPCVLLNQQEIRLLFNRYRAFNFSDDVFSIGNMQCDDTGIYYTDKAIRCVALIDVSQADLPSEISTYTATQELGRDFPVDNLSFLLNSKIDTLLYNQVIKIPDQRKLKSDLEIKKKRHSSMPDPANDLSVEDIDAAFRDVAKENELLVYAHYNILICDKKERLDKAVNYIENSLFSIGVIPGRNTYNQLELFRCAIPGNAEELKDYDLFLTARETAVCFFFKERLPQSDNSNYRLWFTDRQGVPIGIDTSELPMATGRISNRNRFILGPSGSGKSFFTNSYAKQCFELGADVVIVDTGNSYYGLCKYLKGKYITYTEKQPITMNPFKIEIQELNIEKIQLLVSLISMIWKGVNGAVSVVENDILTFCVSSYFNFYFYKGFAKDNLKDLANEIGEKDRNGIYQNYHAEVTELSFNGFYDFSTALIKFILSQKNVRFDLEEYEFVLEKFYRGGIYETILNESVDNTLFNEQFIVFEIDNIKEHELLFPITTLIIMDVFIQKMRHKKNKKILIIEEAWKAIANERMAGYILYLYKTVRKFYGEAIVVTQELNDIIGNPIVKDSIISNSDTICLLDQNKFRDTFDRIAELLALNEVERNKIFTINKLDNKENRNRFKEVYIRRGSSGEVYGVEVPLPEYLTYTTERKEKEALQAYLDRYDRYETAMDCFIDDFKKSGLSLSDFVNLIGKQETVYTANKKAG